MGKNWRIGWSKVGRMMEMDGEEWRLSRAGWSKIGWNWGAA